jgi:hypothetical protein
MSEAARKPRRRIWAGILLLAALLIIAALAALVLRPGPSLRNVILISVDTLRADHLSYAGYHRLTSPAIDRPKPASYTRPTSEPLTSKSLLVFYGPHSCAAAYGLASLSVQRD